MNRQALLFSTLLMLSCVASAVAEPSLAENAVHVRLFDAHRPIKNLEIIPPFLIVRADTTTVVNVRVSVEKHKRKVCLLQSTKGERIIVARGETLCIRGIGFRPVALALVPSTSRQYHGDILLGADRQGRLQVINRVTVRSYVNDVVASESPLNAPREMLKAQAVLTQTMLCHRKSSDEIGDSTQNQCYLGAGVERADVTAAVSSVWAKLLYYHKIPAIVYYHSTCAGGTSSGAQYFHLPPGDLPYLQTVSCKNCHRSPFWNPTVKEIPYTQFVKIFGNGLPAILERDAVGRPLSIKLANGKIVSGYDFWIHLGQSFGWDKAPGTRYSIKMRSPDTLVIESTGAGHGVGLCQWGAVELARRGKAYKEILRYYFPTCEVR